MAIAVVTGSSTGIGFATAEALARAGHDVIATMRDPERAPALADLARRDRLPITVMRMDVDSDASVTATLGAVLTDCSRIDVLVNNAGIGGLGSVEETPLLTFRQTMETNYFGALRCMQAVLPGMRARKSGLIVNVTSIAGRIASTGQPAYSASKFALEALSECLAAEVKAHGIRVAIVEPGIIATPIFDKEGMTTANKVYPQARRLKALFSASLERPAPASVVGDAIRDIVASDSWTLRYPVGPDALPWLQWRAHVSDEHYVERGALDDESWCQLMESSAGLNVRKYLFEAV
jgi:NAD(P)-dependent dehydrogenase (short-subunit alcohol dehydrogenase family)